MCLGLGAGILNLHPIFMEEIWLAVAAGCSDAAVKALSLSVAAASASAHQPPPPPRGTANGLLSLWYTHTHARAPMGGLWRDIKEGVKKVWV